jgi:pyruvate formate lyase activating enzyme
MLVLPSKVGKFKEDHSLLPENDLFDFFKKRVGKLDGVVITGGEPTLHKDLPEFMGKIKKLGFKVKLDTNGTNPEMLKKLVASLQKGGAGGLIDYIAMDIKCPLDKYKKTTKFKGSLSNIKKSVKIIMESGLPYEFRTTVVPGLVEKKDIAKMGEMIKGARIWYLQQFKPDTELVDNKLRQTKPYSDEELKEMAKIAKKYVKKCVVR